MNNNDELKDLISTKSDEIEKLKNEPNYIELKDYYLNKYQEMFTSILNNRSLEINETMNELDNEISSLEEAISNNAENIKSNEINQQKIEGIEETIYDLFSQIELARFNMDEKETKVKNESIELFKEYYKIMDNWNNRLNSYYNGLLSNYDLIKSIEELRNSINTKGYENSIKIKENEAKIKIFEEEFKKEEDRIHQEIDEQLKEKQNIERRIVNTSLEYQDVKKNELLEKKEHKKTYLEEIKQAFNDLSVRQLKEFNDVYVKNRLVSKPVENQMEEYDELFKKFKSQLLTVDTLSNQQLKKKKRLQELTQEKSRLDDIKRQKEELVNQSRRLKEAYAVIDKTLMDLNKHLNDIKTKISSFRHQQFTRLENDYEQDLSAAKTKINLIEKEIENLHEERTYQLFDPVKDVIDKLDSDLMDAEKRLNEAINEYNSIKNDYEDFLKNEQNAELKKLLEEGKYFEENIPRVSLLHNKLQEKILAIDDKANSLDNDLENYQSIIIEINAIENEN